MANYRDIGSNEMQRTLSRIADLERQLRELKLTIFNGSTGPQGPAGPAGTDGVDGEDGILEKNFTFHGYGGDGWVAGFDGEITGVELNGTFSTWTITKNGTTILSSASASYPQSYSAGDVIVVLAGSPTDFVSDPAFFTVKLS